MIDVDAVTLWCYWKALTLDGFKCQVLGFEDQTDVLMWTPLINA